MHWSLTFVHLVVPRGAFFVLQKGFSSFMICFSFLMFSSRCMYLVHLIVYGRPLGIEIQEFVVTYVVVNPSTSFWASIV